MPHLRKFGLFVLLSLADLALTWFLLSRGKGEVYEGNPIAHSWLVAYGWGGLIVFKAGIVLVVAGLVFIISRYRPRLGGLVLAFACCTLGAVVIYSCYLVRHERLLVRSGAKVQQQNEFLADAPGQPFDSDHSLLRLDDWNERGQRVQGIP